jgi:GMP synthase (glutamine-hydrolysing)
VGGLPEKMNLKLLEPLRLFFKDQVRAMGVDLGINPSWLNRHPFPGPGLGVRILGEITQEKLSRLKLADEILFQEMKNHHCYQDFWQSAAIYIPQKTVGVKGDERAYEEVICIRLVNSTDAMTATSSRPSWDFLELVSSRITNEVEGITRVVYDITSKPPGTIEWE